MKIKILSIVFFLLSLSGCATMMGDRTVNVTGDQIAQKLNEKLALPIQLMKIFNMNLSNSVVNFDKTTGRMTTTMDTKLSSELFEKTLNGKLGISGKMRFDAATQSVVLDEPKIENLDLDGVGGDFLDIDFPHFESNERPLSRKTIIRRRIGRSINKRIVFPKIFLFS